MDFLADGVAHESKVGYVAYSANVIRQIEKDAGLLRTGAVQGAHWHFFVSEATGKGGADERIFSLLREHGISFQVY